MSKKTYPINKAFWLEGRSWNAHQTPLLVDIEDSTWRLFFTEYWSNQKNVCWLDKIIYVEFLISSNERSRFYSKNCLLLSWNHFSTIFSEISYSSDLRYDIFVLKLYSRILVIGNHSSMHNLHCMCNSFTISTIWSFSCNTILFPEELYSNRL